MKPFWEDSYRRPGRLDTFGGGKPGKDVVRAAGMLPDGARALDLGCGEGRNALYLATVGFRVTAVDISPAGIDKLRTVASERGLEIDASVCDMRMFAFDGPYDLIVSQGCLHLIRREEWQMVLHRMKAATADGGIHVTGVFTDNAPEPEDQRGLMVGLFREGELFTHYDGWEIIEKNSFLFEHKHPDGPRHTHAGDRAIARKLA